MVKPNIVTAPTRIEQSEAIPWGSLILTCLAACFSTMALINHAPLLPMIQQDFKVDNTWFGMLTSALLISHTALQLPSGYISDALGAKRTMLFGLVEMGIAMLWTGVAPTVEILFMGRLLMGIGTATSFVGGLACVNTIMPANKRTLGQSYFGAFATSGYLIALLLPGRLTGMVGWKGVFIVEALITLIAAAVMWRMLRIQEPRTTNMAGSIKESLALPHLYILGLAQIFTFGVLMALGTWTTAFLWKEHGMGIEWAGSLGALGMAGALIARIVSANMTSGRERLTIVSGGFATAACLFLLPHMPGIIPTVIMLTIAYACASFSFGAVFSYGSIISNRGTPGRNVSVTTFVANLGAMFLPPLIGYVLDTAGSFTLGFTVVAAICVGGSLIVVRFLPYARREETL